MKCEICGEETYIIHINSKHEKCCEACFERMLKNMHLHLMRISTGEESTLGALYVDGKFECYVLEDTKRTDKIDGETRIPDGIYNLALRNEGGLNQKYSDRFPDTHKGMIWIKNVPGFDWIYIHIGNKRGHTEGCLLVGDSINNNQIKDGFISSSMDAYLKLYNKIARVLTAGFSVTLRISNFG